MIGRAPENRPRQGMDYGETEEVQETHAAIYREKVEPRVGREPLSLWLIAIYGLAVFFGGAYLGRYAGNFSGDGLDYLGGAPRVATKSTAGGKASVVKSLDERISHRPMVYFAPTDPRGPADQLRAPELLEAAARK